ncbi:MAG: 16S rRNA (cytosine(1402)-N(4))-methyltransferase RsmH [Bacillota bacterium]|nr:16S rRNA (cytosine(1402)-N(4))-methyltransferase RsmH [Bacillota bacterium]
MNENGNEAYDHIPVMLNEVLFYLKPAPGKIIVDGTLGGGGHAEAVLKKLLPGGKLIGIDRDDDAIRASRERLLSYGPAFQAVKATFGDIAEITDELKIEGVDGLLLDLGVSSYQLDQSKRGFSYRDDVFLDMRMDQDLPKTAAALLEEMSHREMARIFREYGDEKWAGRIASFIIKYRLNKGPVSRSGQLVEIIRNAVPAAARRKGGHPAKRVFQALRIAVNQELDNLEKGLRQGIDILQPGGRIVVISYHSLEDGIVKKIFRDGSERCICPPGIPVCGCGKVAVLKNLTKKPIYPEDQEISVNPRSKSARLRSAEKVVLS